ncbi:hypothetical protein C0991_002063 [Blastosporella zonata]|nr:hypothetical protein C0991_002063 [Blastosporella zonata]
MPKMPVASATTRTTRRSSRLNKNQDTHQPALDSAAANSRTKRQRTSVNERPQLCANDDPAVAKPHLSSIDLRRSQRITPAELLKREKTLLKEELECKRRAAELDDRALLLLRKEAEASLILSQVAEREAAGSLAQLEEHFTCALTFPFVPNRAVAAVCESLIEKLRCSPSSPLVVKREDSEGAWGTGWASCSRKKEASKEVDEKVDENADVAGWREGGFTRTEWLKKDRRVDPPFRSIDNH